MLIIVFLLLFANNLFAQDLTLEEIARQKAETQKDFKIGQLMMENAQMRYEKLLQVEEALKAKENKSKETKK